MAFTVQRSIHIEQLADLLAQRLREPREMPFRQEIILVDGKALSNWLSYYLVNEADLGKGAGQRGLGIHMRAELMNTTRFATWAKLAFNGQPDSERVHDALSSLPTRIFRWLGENPEVFEIPAEAGDGGAARLDLANRLAKWLNELIRDDPKWILEAEKKPSGRLEKLWQAMSVELKAEDSAGANTILTAAHVLEVLNKNSASRKALAARVPGRIHLFSTSDISITLLKSLKTLTEEIDVHTHLLQPSSGFHLDLKSADTVGRIGYEHVGGEETEQGIPMETAGALFLRQTAKHFRRQLKVTIDELDVGGECEDTPKFNNDLLGGLKEAIANFDAPEQEQPRRATADDTISIHRCHTALREVEVLRDEILRAMSNDSKLRARDILVLSPKPEIYAPLMAGVLMLRKPSIGFSTAGVEGSTKSPLADLAVRMLELPSGRFTSQEILEICELSVIRDHFGWESDSTYRIRRWFESAPFYWGMDDLHRERLTGDNFNNWSALDFINKVSLGTAMRSEMKLEGESQTIPLDDLDGREDLRLAAGLMVLIDRLRMWSRFAQELRQPLAWVKEYAEHLEALLPDEGESAEERVHIERALAALQAACAVAGEEPIDLATFRTLALPYLDFDYARGQFLGGGVTLSSLRAGNIHPAKVIAFIGMSDGAYPPRGVVPGPELKTERPTEAERSRDQSEQRGMHTVMLAISAARSRLILTFPGFAGNSGKDAAAALPVELIRMAAARICPDFKVQRHGLHSHEAGKESSDDHFGKAATLTLDTNALDVAAMLAEKNTTPPIPTLEMDVKGWTFEEWLVFWNNPVRGGFERAQASVPWTSKELVADEPLEALRDWSLNYKRKAESWLQAYLNNHKEHADWDLASSTGLFPLTALGYGAFLDLQSEMQETEPGIEPLDEEFEYYMGQHHAKAVEIDHGTTRFLRAKRVGSWLVLSVNRDEISERNLVQGISALAYLQQQFPELRNVAVIGPHGETATGKIQCNALAAKNLPADLGQRFGKLASSAISREMVIGSHTLADAAIGAIKQGDKVTGASVKSLGDFNGNGDKRDRYVRLVLSGSINFDAINTRLRETLNGAERMTATKIQKSIAEMPNAEAKQ